MPKKQITDEILSTPVYMSGFPDGTTVSVVHYGAGFPNIVAYAIGDPERPTEAYPSTVITLPDPVPAEGALAVVTYLTEMLKQERDENAKMKTAIKQAIEIAEKQALRNRGRLTEYVARMINVLKEAL